MDHPQRLIYLALAILWAIFRLIRYVRAASAKRPGPAVPASAGTAPQPPTAAVPAPAARSPLDPVRAGGGLAGKLAAAVVFIAGNLMIWPLLFMVPALDDVPTILRLTAGVLANFYLLHLARTVAARTGSAQRSAADENNPIK